MKIAAIIPVGPIDCMGYQYHEEFTVNRFIKQFNHVYIASSVTVYPVKYDKVQCSLIQPLEYNNEYSIKIIRDVLNRAIKKAIEDEIDFILLLMVNNYITDYSHNLMTDYIKKLKIKNLDLGFYHNRRQFEKIICKRSELMPYIINLTKKNDIQIIPDGVSINGKKTKWISGFFGSKGFEVTDIELAINNIDFEYKTNYYTKQQLLQNHGKNLEKYSISDLIATLKFQTKMISIDYLISDKCKEESQVYALYPKDSLFNELDLKFSPRIKIILITIWRYIVYKEYRRTVNAYKATTN